VREAAPNTTRASHAKEEKSQERQKEAGLL